MEWQAVKSSNVESISYDQSVQSLHVKFKGGAVYSYSGVDKHRYDAMMSASSVGSYIHSTIKPNHPCSRIDQEAKR
jgi:hypothetical protein